MIFRKSLRHRKIMTYYPKYDKEFVNYLKGDQYKKFLEDVKYQTMQFNTNTNIFHIQITSKLLELKNIPIEN